MFKLRPALKAKGDAAEGAFRTWLNESGVPYLYIEQSPLNVPTRLRGRLKRPDYIVGIPYMGGLAVDVKAKSSYEDCFLFEVTEIDKLACFQSQFHLSVQFACLDLDKPDCFFWVPLNSLIGRPSERRGRARVISFPVEDALEVSFNDTFLQAVAQFSHQSLAR